MYLFYKVQQNNDEKAKILFPNIFCFSKCIYIFVK
jgi:hypothetical protein